MSVVNDLCLDGWDLVAVLQRAAVVVPIDPLGGGDLEMIEALPGRRGLMSLHPEDPPTHLRTRVRSG